MVHYYNAQVKRYISQFLRIFSGLQVQTGVDRDSSGDNDYIDVPVHYGSMDRVIANVLHKEGTFVPNKVPVISGYLTSIELNPEAKKAKTHQEHIARLETGNTKPSITTRLMGVPYKAQIQLSIFASNTDQMLQMLEQILLMFNPYLNIQKSDNIDDWSYLTSVELISMNNEENYPADVNERLLVWSLDFTFDCWLNFPAKEQESIIENVSLRVHDDTIQIIGLETAEISSLPSMASGVAISTSGSADMDVT